MLILWADFAHPLCQVSCYNPWSVKPFWLRHCSARFTDALALLNQTTLENVKVTYNILIILVQSPSGFTVVSWLFVLYVSRRCSRIFYYFFFSFKSVYCALKTNKKSWCWIGEFVYEIEIFLHFTLALRWKSIHNLALDSLVPFHVHTGAKSPLQLKNIFFQLNINF